MILHHWGPNLDIKINHSVFIRTLSLQQTKCAFALKAHSCTHCKQIIETQTYSGFHSQSPSLF
jgi:hypothetical protein